MKKTIWFILLALLAFIPSNVKAEEVLDDLTIHVFVSKNCQYCAKEKAWLEEYKLDKDFLNIKYYEVDENRPLLDKIRKTLEIKNSFIPVTVIGTDYFIGYNNDIRKQIEAALDAYFGEEYCDIVDLLINEESTSGCRAKNNGIYTTSDYRVLPFLGEVNVKGISLPFIAMIIGYVDGFNPCAMWALIFIITLLFGIQDRRKMWIIGISFLTASAVIYALFMVSWLTVASSFASTGFRYLIAVVALGASGFNLFKYLKMRRREVGCEVTSKEQKSKLALRAQKIIKEKSLVLSILGMIGLAFSVYVVEFACTAGLPLLFIQILTMNSLGIAEYALYIFIYIFFFLINDIIIFIIAMKTLKVTGMSNKFTKYSHLIGGIIMLIMGILLIVKPAWIMFNF